MENYLRKKKNLKRSIQATEKKIEELKKQKTTLEAKAKVSPSVILNADIALINATIVELNGRLIDKRADLASVEKVLKIQEEIYAAQQMQ